MDQLMRCLDCEKNLNVDNRMCFICDKIFKNISCHQNYRACHECRAIGDSLVSSAHLISKDDGTWSEESIANAAFESPLPDIYPDSDEGQLTPRLRRCLKYESSDSLYVNIGDLSDREIFNSSTPPIDELTILYISDSENIPPSDDEEISCAQKPKFEQENSPVINRKKLRPPSFLENAPIAKRCINFGEELSLN